MSDELRDRTLAFVEDIKSSQTYIDYLNYKSFLSNQPELQAQVDKFRKESFNIQVGHRYGYFNAYENLLSLNLANEDLLSEPIVRSFLKAELELSKMINGIFNTFAEGLNMDLDFLDL